MGKWAVRSNTVRISGLRDYSAAHCEYLLRRELTREFGPVEEVIVLDETQSLLDAFAIFKEVACAKRALTARTIAIEHQTLTIGEPSSGECSKLGIWRKSRAGSGAGPAKIPSPLRLTGTFTPDDSTSPKLSPLFKPQFGFSSTEASSSSLDLQFRPTTRASNQADPAATKASYENLTVITKTFGQVAATEPSQQSLDGLSAAIPTTFMPAIAPSLQSPTSTRCTSAPGYASQNLATTDADSAAPASALVTTASSSLPPTTKSTTPTLSRPIPSSFPSNALLAPKIQALPPFHLPLGRRASFFFDGSHSNLSGAVAPFGGAFGTAHGDIPSQNQSLVLQTGAQTQNSTAGQPAALACETPTQATTAKPASLSPLSAPAGSSVSHGDSKVVRFTQEQFRAAQTKYNKLRKAHEEAVNARARAGEELESERKRSEGLKSRLEDAEKAVEQMKRQQEALGIRHRGELGRAQNTNAEQMEADIETINKEWMRKLRENEERLLRELEQAKRQVNEERELSSKREAELRARLQGLGQQSDWKSELKAAEEERLKLQQALADLNQALLRADADAQVELSRRQELERQLDDCWAKERARPELVKASLLLEAMARMIGGPRAARETGPDETLNPVEMEDIPAGDQAKRRRLQ